MKKKFLAKLLVLFMVLAMAPATALATEAANGSNEGSNNEGSESGVTDSDTVVEEPGTTTIDTTITTTVSADDITIESGSAVITVTVVNGTASVALNDAAVESLADLAQGGEIALVIQDEGASKLNVSFPAKALSALAQETGAALTIQSSVATISIPNDVLCNELGTSGTVKISAQSTESSVGFTIQVSGKALKGIKGVQVTF